MHVFRQAARCSRILAEKMVFKRLRYVCKTPLFRSYFLSTVSDLFFGDAKRFMQPRNYGLFARFIAEEVRPLVRTVEAYIKVEIWQVANSVFHLDTR